jgi:hypothetical protein
MARAKRAARKGGASGLKARERRAEKIAEEISEAAENVRPMANFQINSFDKQTARASEKFQEAQKKFEPIFPRVAGKLSDNDAKDDKFERFSLLIKKIQEKAQNKREERKHTFSIRIAIAATLILLGINLAWIAVALA